MDPCASDSNHKCEKYYTVKEDGLKQSWKGERVFCNPPYSEKDKWIRKCYSEAGFLNTIVVLLIPSATETRVWHEYCMKADEIRFVKGRIDFHINGKKPSRSGNNYGSALIIFTILRGHIKLKVSSFYHKEKDLMKYQNIEEWLK